VYYVFERGMDRGAGRGRGRDSTRKESGLERETNMTSRREIPLSVYMQGGGDRGTRRIFCVWCLCWCEKVTRCGPEGVSLCVVRWVEVRPFIRFRPAPHWLARDAFRETHG